jgi:hypothetical protein
MEHNLRVAVVCRGLGAPRSTIDARRRAGGQPGRPGPVPPIGDEELVRLIRRVLADSPFAGEGDRKVRARLGREHGVQVSGKRVLRLLRGEGLLAPQRVRGRRRPRPHDGTIIPEQPNLRWGTDATMAWTRTDGWGGWLPGWTIPPLRRGPTWPRSATGSPPCSRSMTRSSTAGAGWMRTWLVACRCGMTGDRNIARPTSWARSAGWGSATTRRSGRAGDQRLR